MMTLKETVGHYAELEMPVLKGDPFDLARSSCLNALHTAQDVRLDEDNLAQLAAQLDVETVKDVATGYIGDNADTVSHEFHSATDAANFAVLFSLLQFGHGFRYDLHRLCGRGAAKTITRGVRNLGAAGDFSAERLARTTVSDVRQAFGLPRDDAIEELTTQLHIVIQQAATVLDGLGMVDFDAFCRAALSQAEAAERPAATLVRSLANAFPAFNDQGVLHDGSRVVLLKKASLATGELRRLAGNHDELYRLEADLDRVVAPIDNVIPAVLVYHGVLRLSGPLHNTIHQQRKTLDRGPQEAELRATALAACEKIAEAVGRQFFPLDLGYYLWLSGKESKVRRFARHHTKNTIFY